MCNRCMNNLAPKIGIVNTQFIDLHNQGGDGRRTGSGGLSLGELMLVQDAQHLDLVHPSHEFQGLGNQFPTISFSPAMIWSKSSSCTLPSFSPNRSTDSVRIWLILTHDGLGNPAEGKG
jgi:hypothetical protein